MQSPSTSADFAAPWVSRLTQTVLDSVMRKEGCARVVYLHGPRSVGKSTVIRSLLANTNGAVRLVGLMNNRLVSHVDPADTRLALIEGTEDPLSVGLPVSLYPAVSIHADRPCWHNGEN